MSKKTKGEIKRETEAEVFSAMAAEGHLAEGNTASTLARHLRADPVLVPIIKNKQGPKGRTRLMFAAKEGDLERVRFLLEKGSDPTKEDADFHSVLYYAAIGGPDVIDLLVQNGADLDYQNRWGNTALHYAAAYGNLGAVMNLCNAGANVNKVNDNQNIPLMEALEPIMVRVGNVPHETKTAIVRVLQEAGSDITMKNKQGSTALHLACHDGNVEAVRFLCEADSDVDARDNDGSTPLITLIRNSSLNETPRLNIIYIVKILLAYGANPSIEDERRRTLKMFINSEITGDERLRTLLNETIDDAMAEGGAAEGGGASRKRRKTRNTRKGRKTRKARS